MISPNTSENEPVTIVSPRADTVPALFDSPHSGSNYPDDFDAAIEHMHLRRMEDAFVDELFSAAPDFGATLIAARFSRGYLDANRSDLDIDTDVIKGWKGPTEPSEKSRGGKGLVWTHLHSLAPLYERVLTGDEVKARIETYWKPYHDAIACTYDELHSQFGCVYHLDCHSMRAMGNIQDVDGESKRPDFVISDHDGESCAPAFLELVVGHLRAQGFDVAVNFPFKGAELTRRYADPAGGRHALQIEINRKLYMDEVAIEKNAGFDVLQSHMSKLAKAVCVFAATS